MASSTNPSHNKYGFRSSTLQSTAATLAKNPIGSKTGRTILPLTDTPSLVVEPEVIRTLDPEKSAIKSHLRVQNYWIDALIEKVTGTQFSRGKTHLQGSRAPLGYQAAHYCLAPHTLDPLTEDVIDSVVEKGLTPVRSKPFLQARIELTSPDSKVLQNNHKDHNFVTNFVLEKLPIGAEKSSLFGTRFSLSRNATFDNPDESNQFDTLLESNIKPELKRLQSERVIGDIDEDTATAQLVDWLIHYYETSIQNNQQRLDHLSAFFAAQKVLAEFEDMYSDGEELPEDEFQEYIKTAEQLLKFKALLLAPLEATSRCHHTKQVRNDYYYLSTLVNGFKKGRPHSALESLFHQNSRHFAVRPELHETTLRQKYEFFIQEAKAQREGILVFADPCTILGLKTALFGICVDKVRVPPTETQLREQIFSIFKLATPYKSKTRARLFNQKNKDPGSNPNIAHNPKLLQIKKQLFMNVSEDQDLL